jgi:hypothetical protein
MTTVISVIVVTQKSINTLPVIIIKIRIDIIDNILI